MTAVLYIVQPEVIDLPAGEDPAALAWFAQFSSGHLRHADQPLSAWAGENNVQMRKQKMAYHEYLRLLKESHWYE